MIETPLVCVVDDDRDVRNSLRMLLESVGIDVAAYASADAFLAEGLQSHSRPCCLLLDVRMPGMGGIALLEQLGRNRSLPPTIVLTGHGDIPMAVRAMKLGAVDFITKPFNHQALLDLVQETLRHRPLPAAAGGIQDEDLRARWNSLTGREREVFRAIVGGAANKAIAYDLDISIRTVEAHRASIMRKMEVRNLADLVLLSVRLQGTIRNDER